MRQRTRTRILAVVSALVCIMVGCGSTVDSTTENNIQLVDPVGTAVSYETATLRNLYDSQVYSASVCPYVEEYSFEDWQLFSHYNAFPGESVTRGTALLSASTEDIDKEIENLKEQIEDEEEDFQEYLIDTEEDLEEPRRIEKEYHDIVDSLWAKSTWYGKGTPDYEAWESEYDYWGGLYQDAKLTLDMLEEGVLEHTQLYELDHEYNLSRLSYLESRRQKSVLSAGMDGEVASLNMFTKGEFVEEDAAVMAVGDLTRKMLRCEYVNGTTVTTAQDVYAIVDGVRYEIEYEPMGSREYEMLSERDGDVYSTFYFTDDAADVPIGSYAIIVIMRRSREQVLTVSIDSLYSDNGAYYVYVSNENDDRVYTQVQTGMRSGKFVEILSGLSEGDKVLSQGTDESSGETAVLQYGGIAYDFKAVGYLYYPTGSIVETPVEHGICYMTEPKVVLFEQVQEGQVLATIRVVPDEIELQRNKRKLDREQARLNELLALNEKEQEKNKRIIRQRRKAISELEETIAEMEADYAVTEIRSPIDGVVTWLQEFEENQLLTKEEQLFEISSEKHSYIVVEDAAHVLNYDSPADITYTGKSGGKNTVTGTVVTLQAPAVSGSLRKDWALISIPAEAVGDMSSSHMSNDGWWNRELFDVAATTRSMENVLLVPKRAVFTENGQTYVKVRLKDGRVVTQAFVAGGSDTSNYWVVEGLAEGMEICLE